MTKDSVTTPFKRFRMALAILYTEGFVTTKEYDKILARLLKEGKNL